MGNYLMCKREASNNGQDLMCRRAASNNGQDLICKSAASNNGQDRPIYDTGRPNVKFEDLPEDVQCTILSKLPLKEVVRTSVLSSKWRYMWVICPKLNFNGAEVCGRNICDRKFIDTVNAVLQNCHGKVIEELKVKYTFDSILVDHLDSWVRFAVSSRTKILAFDLQRYWGRDDYYIFPFELLDNESISCLQHIQLSCVSFKPPSQFRGFPNLRKLDLNLLHVTRKDLEGVLSNCCNLEWLSMVRCHLNDELMVESPLSHLRHLHVVHCRVTKIEFRAVNLANFVYEGRFVPITLSHSTKLENANIWLFKAIFQHAITALLNGLPSMQNLTFHIAFLQVEMQWLWDNPCKFSRLRHLKLFINIMYENASKILYLVPFLRATPFIERLEVHFNSTHELWFATVGPVRQHLRRCKYNYLKNVYITGYKGARGQLEFLLHVVENAPVLEVLTVDTTRDMTEHAVQIAQCCLSQKHFPNVKFFLI